jgi:hypothetical protein
MRGILFDLQTVCGLPWLPTQPPSALLGPASSSGRRVSELSLGALCHPAVVFLTVLHATVLPLVEVYMRLHPSRARMEQFRVDVGLLCMGVLALLPFGCVARPLTPACVAKVDDIVWALEGLVCAMGLMAGPAPLVLAFVGDVDREAVMFEPRDRTRSVGSSGRWCWRGWVEKNRGRLPCSSNQRVEVTNVHPCCRRCLLSPLSVMVFCSCVADNGASIVLPPALLAWETDFRVVARSPRGDPHCAGDAPFNPLMQSDMHDCVRDVAATGGSHDDLRSLQLYSWPREVLLQPRLTKEQAMMYIAQRHELCDWEYPPLSSDDVAIRSRLGRFKRGPELVHLCLQ